MRRDRLSSPSAAPLLEILEPRLLLAAALSINDVAVDEGNSGTTPAVFTVTLSQAIVADATVNWATADGTATVAGNDYVAASGILTIPAGQTTGIITMVVKGDTVPESDKTIFLNIDYAEGADIVDGQGRCVILDDDGVFLPFGGKTKAQFNDANHEQVTVQLTGPGSGQVHLSAPDGVDALGVVLNGTTALSSLTITTTGLGCKTTVGGIVVNGFLNALTAKTTDLLGGIAVTGSLRTLQLDDVAGGSTISIGGPARPTDAVTIRFDQVSDLAIDSRTPISALTVTEWRDVNTPADAIRAPWLGRLTTTGRKADLKKGILVLAGDFEADLVLDGAGKPRQTLGAATIVGQLAGATWLITGAAGSITAASTGTDWAANFTGSVAGLTVKGNAGGSLSAKSMGSIVIGGNLTGARIDVEGYLARLTVRDILNGAAVLAGGTANQKTTISAHDIGDGTTIDVASSIASLTAARVGGADFFAPSLGSLSTKGDKALGIPGDFAADVTLSGQGLATGQPALGNMTVGGSFRDGLVLVNGGVGSVKVSAIVADVPGKLFGIDAEAVKSVSVASPKFAWAPQGPRDQSIGDFHVTVEAQPGPWPLKDAAWALDAPGPVETITWQDSQGQTIQSKAISGEVHIIVDPWKTSLARVENMVSANGGTLFAQLPAVGLYWARVASGEEAAFIGALAGSAVYAYPNLVTGPRELTIPTSLLKNPSVMFPIPDLSTMVSGNVILEGAGEPLDWSDDIEQDENLSGWYIQKNPDGSFPPLTNGRFVTTIIPGFGATHTDVVEYYDNLSDPDPAMSHARVVIPGLTTACDMASIAAVIQKAYRIGDSATINLSWGTPEILPWDPGTPVAWETYNQTDTFNYLASMQGVLKPGVKGTKDAIIVQAAGNSATNLTWVLDKLHLTQIIEVGALDAAGDIAWYSNYSTSKGTMIYVPVTGMTDHYDLNDYGVLVANQVGGTSFAAPQLWDLVKKIRKNRPDLTPAQIRQILFHPDVAPLQTVHLPYLHEGETMKVPVIENPRDPAVLTAALAVADALFPPPGITVSPTSGLVTTEGGGKATFTVVLRSKPTANVTIGLSSNVTIGLSSSDTTEGRVCKSSLVFTPKNWSVAQVVTVVGVDDSIVDGDQAYTIITSPAVSGDPAYNFEVSCGNGVDPDDVNVTNKDNDESTSPSITLSPLSAQVIWQYKDPFDTETYVGFQITVSGIAAGPVGTEFNLPITPDGFTMDSWTGYDYSDPLPVPGYPYRKSGDPSSTHFSYVVFRSYGRSELPQVVTIQCGMIKWYPGYYKVADATASITLE